MSSDGLRREGEGLYGTALPDVWRDHKNITVSRRMFSDRVGRLTLRDDGDMVDLLDPHPGAPQRHSQILQAGAVIQASGG